MRKFLPLSVISVMAFLSSCITLNTTYSKLSPEKQRQIHITPFGSNITTPAHPQGYNDVVLKDINIAQLKSLVEKSTKRFKWILFYTAGCHGTPYIMPYVDTVLAKYSRDVDVFVVASDDYATSNAVKQVLLKYIIPIQTYIVNNSYGEYFDNRKKGYIMRKEICAACTETIGVPYNVVFEKNGTAVFRGYRKYKGEKGVTEDEDFIGKLVK